MQRRGGNEQPVKDQRRSGNKPKARNAPTAQVSGVDLQEQLDRRTRERDEALEQLAATSEVLRLIPISPGELKPVFEAMLANATRICEAKFGVLHRYEKGAFHPMALLGVPPAFAEFIWQRGAFRPAAGTPLDRLLQTRDVVYTVDAAAESTLNAPGTLSTPARLGGARSLVAVPMIKKNELVGAIVIYRQEVRPFTDRQIALLTNFASQAVIATENVRLLNELRQRTDDLSEALEQQTATSEVLKVISSSPGELELVFEAMLENATRICEAKFGTIFRYDGEFLHWVAGVDTPPALVELQKKRGPYLPESGTLLDRVLQTREVAHSPDYAAEPIRGHAATLGGARSTVAVPMLKDSELVGAIIIYRQEVKAFTDKQIELVKTFAAQAVIAIENTRLLNQLRQRTEDLSEALERQTATSEVLKVISSSPGELELVFNAMLENATHICDAKFGILFQCDGNTFDPISLFGVPAALAEFLRKTRTFSARRRKRT